MKESLSQSLNQRLQQRLSPMQVQFVRLLEMNGAEIEDEVRRALDENPALEATDSSTADISTDDHDDTPFTETAEELQRADYRSEDDIPSYRFETSGRQYGDDWTEPVVATSGETLQQYLLTQLSSLPLTPRQQMTGEYIVGNIDDNGYLTRSFHSLLDDIAVQEGVELRDDELEEMLKKVRELDPPGVGATDLRDCLLLQLRRRPNTVSVNTAREIVANYFDMFSHKHFDRIMAALEIDSEALRDAIDEIKSLNPKPGALPEDTHSRDTSTHITPDFSVETDGDTITLTLLNNLPQLQIESTFSTDELPSQSRSTERRREAMAFIRQRRDDAATFIKTLQMRQETLYRVMSAIVQWQRQFFLTYDETKLRPMILKDIASLTGYDLSVISRATTGKYVATRAGIYPLKFFFNERPKEDTDTSSHEILAALRDIIATESKRRPLSDEAIASALSEKGYSVARRTVTKYREREGIPVARLRKEI
ncbi:MAG: RNA polymerase factor sigma-54 [Paramuribaculum sp.]|nr:RNA polymerase factor sigma-54 [Paramuribaculum sp.]